jgi:hypothetical protein
MKHPLTILSFNDSPRWKPGLYFADDPTVEVLSDVHAL